ncbi:MAG: alpha/beta fold hydrolase [Phycisphaerales bacterium]|nr:alpha/beta fold hydrolase [Phycisphaerales bacterium]
MITHLAGADLYMDARGHGRPVLLVHGFPLSGELWAETAAALADRYRCLVPDLRGHGRSGATAEVSIGRFADDVMAQAEAAGETGRLVVVGLSMGGAIAFEVFRRYRERVGGLGLVCCRATAETAEGRAKREELAQVVLRRGSVAAAEAMIGNLLAPVAAESLRAKWKGIMSATPAVGVAAAARALGSRPDSLPTLAAIDVPTLVVAGERDAITPSAGMREMAGTIRGARFVEIAGAGHLPPVERPREFAAVLRGWLDGLG